MWELVCYRKKHKFKLTEFNLGVYNPSGNWSYYIYNVVIRVEIVREHKITPEEFEPNIYFIIIWTIIH